MNKKILVPVVALAVLVGVGAGGTALAYNRVNSFAKGQMPNKQEMLQDTADFLDMTADELKTDLETKKIQDILGENGITKEQMQQFHHDNIKQMMEDKLQQMVDEGKITQEQVDARKEKMA